MIDPLAYADALDHEVRQAQAGPGTTVVHPTLKKGVVTGGAGVHVEVDGLPALNVTGWGLTVDEVVWLLVDQGRRLVVGVTTIKEV